MENCRWRLHYGRFCSLPCTVSKLCRLENLREWERKRMASLASQWSAETSGKCHSCDFTVRLVFSIFFFIFIHVYCIRCLRSTRATMRELVPSLFYLFDIVCHRFISTAGLISCFLLHDSAAIAINYSARTLFFFFRPCFDRNNICCPFLWAPNRGAWRPTTFLFPSLSIECFFFWCWIVVLQEIWHLSIVIHCTCVWYVLLTSRVSRILERQWISGHNRTDFETVLITKPDLRTALIATEEYFPCRLRLSVSSLTHCRLFIHLSCDLY